MKKQILVAGLALVSLVSFNACKKDKKDDKKSASIVGTWQSKTIYSKEVKNGTTTSEGTENYTDFLATFNSDGTFTSKDLSDSSDNTSGTYTYSGTQLITKSTDGDIDTSNVTVSETELIMTESDSYTSGSDKYDYTYKLTFGRK